MCNCFLGIKYVLKSKSFLGIHYLNLSLDGLDGVPGLDLEDDGLATQISHKDLHS